MRLVATPMPTPQRGYVVVWACFLIATISLAAQWKHSVLRLSDERRQIAENTTRLKAQILKIQNDLTRCLNQIQSNSASVRTYPETPASGLLRHVVCPYTPNTTAYLWSSVEFIKLKPASGFTEWRYTKAGNGFVLNLASTDGNRISITALQRVGAYVLPSDGKDWTATGTPTAPPGWLASRIQLSRLPDGSNWNLTFSSNL